MVNYAVPIVLEKGQGLRSVVTYNNTTSNTIRFGLTSDQEMDIIFGYYYYAGRDPDSASDIPVWRFSDDVIGSCFDRQNPRSFYGSAGTPRCDALLAAGVISSMHP